MGERLNFVPKQHTDLSDSGVFFEINYAEAIEGNSTFWNKVPC